ncbi:MAG: citrate transporter [Bacteroidetes bacterium GWF2_29_10]|nr:MAG: citrate transporter [Bacteroidetes bacterium GWF2_29_10]
MKTLINKVSFLVVFLLLLPVFIFASDYSSAQSIIPSIMGIRLEFIIFALTLVGVALFHHKTMYVALTGLVAILAFKFVFDGEFNIVSHIIGDGENEGEWRTLVNLLGLLFGFAILAKHFEESKFPKILPRFLPKGWKGAFVLLIAITILSSFLDNIAAAMIGGTIAYVVFRGKVHIGYLAAIVAASNAGGAGSVVGDTTTTLMWIDGVNPLDVTHAFIGSVVALFIFGIWGAKQQDKYQTIVMGHIENVKVDFGRIFIVFLILVFAILTNWLLDFPAVGVWIGILLGATFRKTPWEEIKNSLQGTVFLMSLVTIASVMPVNELPPASMWSAFSLGFISAVFDNIPLTKLCLEQGGYDWGILAYSVGFGGSMIWFGSSAGVALSNMYPEAKNTVKYISNGWHVTLAYIVSFFVMISLVGWHPHAPHKKEHKEQTEQVETINPEQNIIK